MNTEYQKSFDKTEFIGNHLPWLNTLRQESLQQFLAQGLPGRREEDWKYTDLKSQQQPAFNAPQNQAEIQLPLNLDDIAAYNLIFVNGNFSASLSSDIAQNKILISPLSVALENVKTALIETKKTKSQLQALNTAFLTDGLYLQLQKNQVLEKPIRIIYVTTDACMYHPRNVIHLQANSNAIIFEEHIALNSSAYFKNSLTQIQLDTGAHLHLYKLQNENETAWHTAATEVTQEKDSQFSSHSFSLGSKLNREDLSVQLAGGGAACQLNGLYIPTGDQHIDHHTKIDHQHSHTQSNEYYKGILRDKSKAVFNGKVIVHPNAQKIQSQQQNKNLLLSPAAEVNTKPELEIYADDVQCAHGATVGQLDPEALFYLRARGIDSSAATALLVEAFAQELLESIQHKEIYDYINQAVKKKTVCS